MRARFQAEAHGSVVMMAVESPALITPASVVTAVPKVGAP